MREKDGLSSHIYLDYVAIKIKEIDTIFLIFVFPFVNYMMKNYGIKTHILGRGKSM